MAETNSKHTGSSQDGRRRSHVRQVYGLSRDKSYYKQHSNESYTLRLIIISVLLALVIAFVILRLEAHR